jgi:hypothetical protein
VGPYIEIFALIKSFEKKDAFYSNHTRAATIKYIKATQQQMQLSSLSSFSYLRDDCHKRVVLISKSCGDSNWCTPYRGKSDQHAICFPRSVHVWPSTIRISRGPRIATFHEVINSDGQSHYSREKGLPTQSTTQRLTDPWVRTQFLSRASHWSSGGKATLCWR